MDEDDDPRVARAKELEKRLGQIRALLKDDKIAEADKMISEMEHHLSFLTGTPHKTTTPGILSVAEPAPWL